MTFRTTVAAGVAALLIAACADRPTDGSAHLAGLPEWSVELEQRLGSLDDPDESFTAIKRVLIGDAEDLYVLDRDGMSMRVYDRAGGLARRIGQAGAGPGEFLNVNHLGFLGDTLYATDDGSSRVSYFSRAGKFLDSRTWTSPLFQLAPMTFLATAPTVVLHNGTALVKPNWGFVVPAAFNEPGVHRTVSRVSFLLIDPHGTVLDTVAWGVRDGVSIRLPRSAAFAINPFEHAPLLATMADGNGVVMVDREPASSGAEPATFRVTLVQPYADTVFTTAIAYDPIPLTDRHVREAVAGANPSLAEADESAVGGRAGLPTVMNMLRDADLIPSNLIPVTDLVTGQDGSIWLARETTGDITRWVVLDRRGQLRGRLNLPRGQRVAAVRDDLLIVIETNELDVPFILRYRLKGR